MEQNLIAAAVQSREAYSTIKQLVNPNDLGGATNVILDAIGEYYDNDPKAECCDVGILAGRITRSIHSSTTSRLIKATLENLPQASIPNLIKDLRDVKLHSIGLRISSELSAGRHGGDTQLLLEQYREIAESSGELGGTESETSPQESGVAKLLGESFSESKLIKLWPESLNDRLDGGSRPGHHILVFAPTEMGKTLFVINLIRGFTAQGLKTLYIGNEDPTSDLMLRYISRVTGLNKYEIRDDQVRAQKLCDEANYNLCTMVGLSPGNFQQIRQLVKKYTPAVVVLDQLRNIDVDSDNRTQALEKAATEARNLGKYGQLLVVSVAQAGDSATGKKVLTRGDVDGSNVGIPGQTDLMIGIGANDEDEKMNIRTISFPKNKLSGNHDGIVVTIDPHLSKVFNAPGYKQTPRISNKP